MDVQAYIVLLSLYLKTGTFFHVKIFILKVQVHKSVRLYCLVLYVCVVALQPSQPNWVMSRAVSLLTSLLLQAVNQYCAHSFARNWQLPFLNQWRGQNDRRKYSMSNLHGRMLLTRRESNSQQSDAHQTEPRRSALFWFKQRFVCMNVPILMQKHYRSFHILMQNIYQNFNLVSVLWCIKVIIRISLVTHKNSTDDVQKKLRSQK